jgi:copper(I)-binding protein
MKKWISALGLSLACSFASAEVVVSDATVREMLPGRTMTAGYFSITNKGEQAVELIGASSTRFGSIELHQHRHHNGMMKMEQITSVSVAPGQQLDFQPGGLHLMLFDASNTITAGQQIPLVFTFKDGQTVEVVAKVSAIPTH